MTATFCKTHSHIICQFYNVSCIYLSIQNLMSDSVIKRTDLSSPISPKTLENSELNKDYKLVYVIEYKKSEQCDDKILDFNEYDFCSIGE